MAWMVLELHQQCRHPDVDQRQAAVELRRELPRTSTQFRDAIDEVLRAREGEMAAQAEEQERQRDREVAAQMARRDRQMATQAEKRERRLLQEQAKPMERMIRGAAREAATKATKDTAKSFKELQKRSEVTRRHHQVFTTPFCPLPPAPAMTDLGPGA